jgi:hypothetical protein
MYEGKEKKGTAALDQPPPRINLSLTIARIWADVLATEPTEQGHRIPQKYGYARGFDFPSARQLESNPWIASSRRRMGYYLPRSLKWTLYESVVWCEWT